jgi:hypothetical protein
MKCLLLGFLALLSAACSPEKLVERTAPREDQQLARAAIDDLAAGRTDALAAKMPAELRGSLAEVEPQMRGLVPPNPQIRLVQANWSSTTQANGATTRQTELGYELSGGGRLAQVEIIIQRDGPHAVVAGFHIEPATVSASSWSSFPLKGQSIDHYAMLAAALAAIAVTIGALVRIWRSNLFKRRWLWSIGAIIGFTTLTLDWSTGAYSFMPISFQLFSAGISKAGLGPWRLGVSLPIIAIWALAMRKRQTTVEAATQP